MNKINYNNVTATKIKDNILYYNCKDFFCGSNNFLYEDIKGIIKLNMNYFIEVRISFICDSYTKHTKYEMLEINELLNVDSQVTLNNKVCFLYNNIKLKLLKKFYNIKNTSMINIQIFIFLEKAKYNKKVINIRNGFLDIENNKKKLVNTPKIVNNLKLFSLIPEEEGFDGLLTKNSTNNRTILVFSIDNSFLDLINPMYKSSLHSIYYINHISSNLDRNRIILVNNKNIYKYISIYNSNGMLIQKMVFKKITVNHFSREILFVKANTNTSYRLRDADPRYSNIRFRLCNIFILFIIVLLIIISILFNDNYYEDISANNIHDDINNNLNESSDGNNLGVNKSIFGEFIDLFKYNSTCSYTKPHYILDNNISDSFTYNTAFSRKKNIIDISEVDEYTKTIYTRILESNFNSNHNEVILLRNKVLELEASLKYYKLDRFNRIKLIDEILEEVKNLNLKSYNNSPK